MNFTIPAPVSYSSFPVMGTVSKHPKLSDVTKWEHQVFEALTASQRSWLSERVILRTYPSKSVVFQPNDLSNKVYLVQSGKVKIEIINGGKNWLIREILPQGNMFGLNSLFGQTTRREYARVLRSKAEVVIFEASDLRRLMEVNFGFAEKLVQQIGQKAIGLEQRSVALTGQSAQARLVHFILDWLEHEGELRGEDWFFSSQVTQEEIGAYIGTGRQTVTEILSELKAARVLTYNWGKFWVHDMEGLKNRMR